MAQQGTSGSVSGGDTDSLSLAVTNSGTGIWDRDVRSGFITYSSGWKAILGYRDDEIGNRIEDSYTRVHPDDLAMVCAAIEDHFQQRTAMYEVRHRLRCKDGSYKWVLSRGKVVARDEHGAPLRMAGVTTDISDIVALSDELRHSVELLTNLTDEVPGLVYQYCETSDGQACFPYASAGIADIFGATPQQAAAGAAAVEAAIHPDDLPAYRASLAASAATLLRWHLEFRVLTGHGGERWCQGDARPRRQPDGGTLWHGYVSDITERKQIERKLRDAAATDFLTGLPNRRQVMGHMEQELARIQRELDAVATVLMFDLDHFKAVNDVYGHATGDEVLKHFAHILLSELRKVDAAGRIGGEEFAVVLAGAGMEEAQAFAERVRARMETTPLSHCGRSITVTVSIGIAAMHAADGSAATALTRADAALYCAKQAGRNRIEASL
ncbi:MAG TPA: diguanylate cyclase [Telluria sp.]|nr:diguanylate cyclase [Telluria sp.]